MHTCPLVNGVQPHVGGTVAVGSVTVMIGGLPAARQGDTIVEAGGPKCHRGRRADRAHRMRDEDERD
jgi:uncharacterized Zn-binding protein involved in type VI secretion